MSLLSLLHSLLDICVWNLCLFMQQFLYRSLYVYILVVFCSLNRTLYKNIKLVHRWNKVKFQLAVCKYVPLISNLPNDPTNHACIPCIQAVCWQIDTLTTKKKEKKTTRDLYEKMLLLQFHSTHHRVSMQRCVNTSRLAGPSDRRTRPPSIIVMQNGRLLDITFLWSFSLLFV